ncbi:RNA-directed DNA polymerase, eukaryota, reverse transcriptase zinc-binding domain protein [Tanacetum coccineum]|uniref:RNA-directed DNA polymerase, eukaryota, reverse transcriptase zinc-binding domain protein n=1 Tax=Tanacetum coccineum TaxID=301880 RepID=A0ABQ5IC56_9ASTR
MAPFVDCIELLAMMVQSRSFACQHILGTFFEIFPIEFVHNPNPKRVLRYFLFRPTLLDPGYRNETLGSNLKIGFVVVVDFVVCFEKFVEMQEKLVVEIEEKLALPPEEVLDLLSLVDLLYLPSVLSTFRTPDSWVWSLNPAVGFTVASVRKFALNKLPTRVNLDRKGIDVDSTLCPICGDDVETIHRLFFTCEMARVLWANLACWWDLDVPFCSSFSDWICWLDSSHLSAKGKLFLDGVGGTVLWTIWNYRNRLIFSVDPPKKASLWDFIVLQSFLWISSRNPKFSFSCVSEENDSAFCGSFSDGVEEIYGYLGLDIQTKPKRCLMINFLKKIYNGLPRDEFVEKDVSADKDVTDKDNIGDKFPIHDPTVKWKLMRPVLVNNPRRLLAKCCRDAKDRKCPFRLWASWMQNERSFQIKKLNDEHSCSRTYEYGTLITTRRGKMKALEQYETCLEDHYGKLWSYAAEILNSNPGSTCKMSVDSMPDGKNYFSSVENRINWGIIEAAKQVMPMAEHRQCARHIYANFRKKYTGVLYRNLFWQAAKATYPQCLDGEKVIKFLYAVRNGDFLSQRMREKHEKWNDGICPNIKKKLEIVPNVMITVIALYLEVIASGQTSFEVRNGYEGFKAAIIPPNKGPEIMCLGHNQRSCPTKTEGTTSVEAVTGTGEDVTESVGLLCASGGAMGRGGKVSARGGKVSARGGKVSARGGKVSATPSTPDSARLLVSSSMNGLRTVNGKVVSSRGRGDGSKSRMYPHGIRPIGFGVSWDPIDGQTMLGDSMGIPRPAWPEGITPQDCIIEAATQSEIAISQSPPVESQEQEAPMQEQPVQEQPLQEQPVQRRPVQQPVQRKSERIAQILFNKPPTPGPGLDPDDAISIE